MNEMGMDGHSLPAAENRDVLILNNYFSIGCFGKGCTAYSCEEVNSSLVSSFLRISRCSLHRCCAKISTMEAKNSTLTFLIIILLLSTAAFALKEETGQGRVMQIKEVLLSSFYLSKATNSSFVGCTV